MFGIIFINIFHHITVEFFLRPNQRFDSSLKSKSKIWIFLCHIFIKFPDLLGLCRKEILFAIDHFNQIVRHELLRMISWKVGIETGFKLSVGKNYKFIERYISEDLWEKLLSTYRMDSYENIWEALFLCHQLFRAVSGEVAERLHYAYPEYDRNITKYTRDMYKKYTGKTGCLDSTYAADIEERREQ